MFLKRWITGIVALPLLILLISKGGHVLFALFVAGLSILALWEYYIIAFKDDSEESKSFTCFANFIYRGSGFFCAIAIIWLVYQSRFELIPAIFVLNLIIIGFFSLFCFKNDIMAPVKVAKQALGIIYIPLTLSFLILIRNDVNGSNWMFFIFLVIAAGDTGALYVGSFLGRNKICPWVSPNKTIEGSVGGLCANILMGLICGIAFLPDPGWLIWVFLSLAIGIAGQVGALFASEFQRAARVKDSGRLLPGHGGFLDRHDSLFFASPVLYFLKTILVKL